MNVPASDLTVGAVLGVAIIALSILGVLIALWNYRPVAQWLLRVQKSDGLGYRVFRMIGSIALTVTALESLRRLSLILDR